MQPYANIPSITATPSELGIETPGSMDVMLDVELPGDPFDADTISFAPDGSLIIVEELGEEKEEKDAFSVNLALTLPEDVLSALGRDIAGSVEDDYATREPHYQKFVEGLTALGINFDAGAHKSKVFGSVNHPLLIEAATQFQARAMAELFPPDGPVKTRILGASTPELIAQADRVQDYLNYLLVYKDRAYYDECEQKLFVLPFTGSEFDKQYKDDSTGQVVSRWVRFDDFIVNYGETSLATCGRYTHLLHKPVCEIKRLQDSKIYRDCDLNEDEDTTETSEIKDKIAEIDGIEVTTDDNSAQVKRDVFEVHVQYRIEGIEDGEEAPYIITIDRATKKVFAIRRNWREADTYRQKRVWFTHKKFLPGFGFYGFGLFHTIGDLGETATKIIQILLDAGAFAAVQGGFRTKDAKTGSNVELTPGVYKEIDSTAEELAKSFYTPNFREPSSTLFNLLGALQELGRRFASTTEVMVGDAATTGPVGTTVALQEQGSKVFSGIHKRLHKAVGDELLNLSDLCGEELNEASYPYDVNGVEKEILKEDFDGRVDIAPVSDPNITSNAQRIALAQAVFQLATQMPDIADRREAAMALLKAMRAPQLEKVFPKPQEAVRADPVSEVSLVTLGRPIRAYLDQNHKAHIAVHMGAIQAQMVMPQMIPVIQAHIAEHIAMDMYVTMQQKMQVPLPPINWGAEKNEPASQSIPPQLEAMIAVQAAQVMQQILAQQAQAMAQQQAAQGQGGGQQGQAPEQPDKSLEVAALNAQTQTQLAAQKAQMKQQELAAKQGMAAQKNQLDQNKLLADNALGRERLQFDKDRAVAELRQEMALQQKGIQDSIKEMLNEFRTELAVKDAQAQQATQEKSSRKGASDE